MLRVCFSCYGSYTTDQVYQWDLNHTIEINGLTMEYAPTIHFCNKKSETALVVQSELNNGLITAPVPNELLQEPYSIIAYVHTYDENNAKTVEIINIPLIKRPKPDDYLFTDNVDIKNFERLETDFAEFTEETDARVQALEVETQKLLDLASDTFTDQTTTTADSTLLLSAEGGIKINAVRGVSKQDGEPTPENPVEINSVVISEIKSVGANLFPPLTERTVNGVTIKKDEKGVYHLSGTATEGIVERLICDLQEDTYALKLNCSKTIGTSPSDSIYVACRNANGNWVFSLSVHQGNVGNYADGKIYDVLFVISAGVNCDGVTIAPILNKGATPLPSEPHTESVVTLSEPITLHGIGDSWDEITPGGIVRKFTEVILDSTRNYGHYYEDDNYSQFKTTINNAKIPSSSTAIGNVLCTHLPPTYQEHGYNGGENSVCIDSTGIVRIGLTVDTGVTDPNTLKAYLDKQYENGTPVTLVYELAEPIIEELSEADRLALHSLKSFDTVTYVSTDSAVEPVIEVEYGTSRVGALALENSNLHIINEILLAENTTDIVTLNESLGKTNNSLTSLTKMIVRLPSTSTDYYSKPWLELEAQFASKLVPNGSNFVYGTISAGATYDYHGYITSDKYAEFWIGGYGGSQVWHVYLSNGVWYHEQLATNSDLANYLPKDGTAQKATADANGNNIADTYATFTKVGDLIDPINEALPYTIVIDDSAKTIDFIDR